MKVAIVHDDLVQLGGAERVLEGLCEIYPDAPIFTSVFDRSNKELLKRFGKRKVITSFMQNIPGWRSLYKILLPLYPISFEQFNFDDFDLVISHTTRFAKSIITKPQTKHICYCHTPPRFLWHFSGIGSYGIGDLLFTKLRLYDQVSSSRVDHFFAGSVNASQRIKKIYRRDSQVIYPFVDFERFSNIDSFDGGYFVAICRLNKYKRVDLVIKACLELNLQLKVVGKGPDLNRLKSMAKGQVEFLEAIDDEMVIRILSGARALIIPGIEDFGLTSIEAQALGKPVIAFAKGGSLETIVDGKTGFLFKNQTVEELKKIIKNTLHKKIDPNLCKQNAYKFSKEQFVNDFQQAVLKIL